MQTRTRPCNQCIHTHTPHTEKVFHKSNTTRQNPAMQSNVTAHAQKLFHQSTLPHKTQPYHTLLYERTITTPPHAQQTRGLQPTICHESNTTLGTIQPTKVLLLHAHPKPSHAINLYTKHSTLPGTCLMCVWWCGVGALTATAFGQAGFCVVVFDW